MASETCEVCGNDNFLKGKLGNGFTNVTSINKLTGSSPIIFTFCSECGEISSMKIEHPQKFR